MTSPGAAPAKKAKGSPVRVPAAWSSLAIHKKEIEREHLRDLFAKDPGRADRFRLEAAGLFLDYSKNRITDKTIKMLLELADHSDLRERIDAMFRGDKINTTENRAVLHIALRTPKGKSIVVDGKDVVPEVHAVLDEVNTGELLADDVYRCIGRSVVEDDVLDADRPCVLRDRGTARPDEFLRVEGDRHHGDARTVRHVGHTRGPLTQMQQCSHVKGADPPRRRSNRDGAAGTAGSGGCAHESIVGTQ